jgi:ribose/xylose/arabinose/galactoside ABC-type transport system permease subunit
MNALFVVTRSLTAIGNNERACRIAGINVAGISIAAFVVAGACAGLGGLLAAGRLFSVDASMGNGDILIVIGGITNLMNLVGVPAALQQVVFGVVLLVAILLSSVQERLRRVRS